jgi:hypothetical protein
VEDFDGTRVTLLNVGLNDLCDRLPLGDMITDGNADRRQSAGGSGSRFDNPTTAADQNSFTGGARRDTPDDAPRKRGDKGHTDDEDQDPVKWSGNSNEMIKLFGRCGPFQRYCAKCALRKVGHFPKSATEPRSLSPVVTSC